MDSGILHDIGLFLSQVWQQTPPAQTTSAPAIWDLAIQSLEAVLIWINHIVGNPGLAIIIFTLLVKLATLPLTVKSTRSMREMQRIQPLVKEINKRYKDDRAKQQSEMMRIYQQHGVNPMGGCLPMLVQIPIFFALYQALIHLVNLNTGSAEQIAKAAAEVTHSFYWAAPLVLADADFSKAFLWVPNLAHADPFYIWPILSGAFQFLSNRMAQPYGSNKNVDPQQQMMNRIMQFLPLYLIVIYLTFPAGNVIYWTFSAIFTAVQTYVVNGWGTLPDVPGLTWLPKRPMPAPPPEILAELEEIDRRADEEKRGTRPRRSGSLPAQPAPAIAGPSASTTTRPPARGFLAKMMEQAQRLAEEQEAMRQDAAHKAAQDADAEPETDEAGERTRPVEAPTRPLAAANGNGTGYTSEMAEVPTGSTLPRKRRNKR